MKQSTLPFKTRKDAPKDEVSLNARLLIQAGFIHKEMAGVYSILPLGLRVIEKIKAIVREEMESLGAAELSMSAFQEKAIWEKTGRWDDAVVDNWFKTTLKSGGELGLGITHEEPITNMLAEHVSSYKDLPVAVFQFQTKFRNELRAKSGIMRGREFLMKDLYSFSATDEEHAAFYNRAKDAYMRIFQRVGLGDITFPTYATGGIFSQFSLEFQTITDAGEDVIYLDRKSKLAINKEIMSDDISNEIGVDKATAEELKTVEVGNIFNLGTKFSEPLGLTFKDEKGDRYPVIMGSYGIGIGRLMGTIAEVFSDEKGLVWPKSVAPFEVHLIALNDAEGKVLAEAENIYQLLRTAGIEVLLDDRHVSAGAKFADADLIGIPMRIVVGSKGLADGTVEITDRHTGEVKTLAISVPDIVTHFHG